MAGRHFSRTCAGSEGRCGRRARGAVQLRGVGLAYASVGPAPTRLPASRQGRSVAALPGLSQEATHAFIVDTQGLPAGQQWHRNRGALLGPGGRHAGLGLAWLAGQCSLVRPLGTAARTLFRRGPRPGRPWAFRPSPARQWLLPVGARRGHAGGCRQPRPEPIPCTGPRHGHGGGVAACGHDQRHRQHDVPRRHGGTVHRRRG